MHLSSLFSQQQIYFPLPWYKSFLKLNYMIPYLLCWHLLTCFLSEDIDPFVKPLRNQFLNLFFRFFCFLLFISNFPFLYYLLYLHYPLFFCFLFLFSPFLCSFSSHFFLLFFPSFSFCFCYPDFLCFSLYYLPHYSGYLVIFTSPVLQSISGLLQASHGISKITLYFCLPIISIFYVPNNKYLPLPYTSQVPVKRTIHIPYIYKSFNFLELKFLLCGKLQTHDQPYCSAIQQCFYCYFFLSINPFQPNFHHNFFQHVSII